MSEDVVLRSLGPEAGLPFPSRPPDLELRRRVLGGIGWLPERVERRMCGGSRIIERRVELAPRRCTHGSPSTDIRHKQILLRLLRKENYEAPVLCSEIWDRNNEGALSATNQKTQNISRCIQDRTIRTSAYVDDPDQGKMFRGSLGRTRDGRPLRGRRYPAGHVMSLLEERKEAKSAVFAETQQNTNVGHRPH